jgi:prevent-host-death family protein
MKQVTIHEAKTNLSKLIQMAAEGEEVIIARGKKPVAKLVKIPERKPRRRLGSAKGRVSLSDDFEAPLEDFQEYMA